MAHSKDTTIAFAFDIDGVLMKGVKPIPGARETIQKLQDLKIPFIFLTNGGGLTEEAHVAKLGQRLDLTFDKRLFVQSHTPYHDRVAEYADKTVLVLGGHGQQIRDLAHAYGFNKVVTPSDFFQEFEHIHPFPEMTRAYHLEHGRRHKAPLRDTKIAAIFVWSSPRDWMLDMQLVIDLLLSRGGYMGTRSSKNGDASLPNYGFQQDDQPKLFFCNPDFEWATQHEQPRFAQGAFREALCGLWAHATRNKAKMQYSVVGKPTEATYIYAEGTLRDYHSATHGTGSDNDNPERRIGRVYMIGDNPESDIVGANSYESRCGFEWRSVLVETGVHVAGTVPIHTPNHTVRDVREAVEWALAGGECGSNVNGEGEDREDGATDGSRSSVNGDVSGRSSSSNLSAVGTSDTSNVSD
ncbi:Uu.00g101850.m01.CDS01 [Anthostomella pinea]|uniref:Uu.00g101850.m01.CDS01 n=1 Tax=Anthostomella pinea TaxID=933095 RepID=A0AAI8VD81_9PEZI|nr:Uu.00g101850.m01.CDS01 [Anthostomella pinea]